MKHLLLVVLLALAGCVTSAHRLDYISIGMSKKDVVRILGTPKGRSAQGNAEFLNYAFYEDYWDNSATRYYVRLIDGKVESFGRLGDFDSTKDPTVNVNVRSK